MSTTLFIDALTDGARTFDTEDAEGLAVGVMTDDPQRPGVVAVVYRGELAALTVPTRYENLPKNDLDLLVSTVVTGAYLDHARDLDRLREQLSKGAR